MGDDALNVLHHRDRIFEDVVIDALNESAFFLPVSIYLHAKGIVDVSTAVARRRQKSAVDLKSSGHRGQIVAVVHGHSLFGYTPELTRRPMLSTTRGRSSR